MIDVLAKGLGKRVEEATIKRWYFEEGDHVKEGDDLVELTAENLTVTIPAPADGVLAEVFFSEGETVQRDEVICVVDDAKRELAGNKDDDDEDTEEEADDGDGYA